MAATITYRKMDRGKGGNRLPCYVSQVQCYTLPQPPFLSLTINQFPITDQTVWVFKGTSNTGGGSGVSQGGTITGIGKVDI